MDVVDECPLVVDDGTTATSISPHKPASAIESDNKPIRVKSHASVHPIYRKVFRISDQTGEVGQKDTFYFNRLKELRKKAMMKGILLKPSFSRSLQRLN